jgi:hypothetical protein
MSNLGWYQILTSTAKKVGGPKQLIGLIAGGGALLGGGAVAGGSVLKKKISSKLAKKRQEAEAAVLYTVYTEGKSNEGLLFKVGDTFKVLETDGDAGLIEKIGDENNPYFVSLKFLSTISDYKAS